MSRSKFTSRGRLGKLGSCDDATESLELQPPGDQLLLIWNPRVEPLSSQQQKNAVHRTVKVSRSGHYHPETQRADALASTVPQAA
jgi:hypothetical protein